MLLCLLCDNSTQDGFMVHVPKGRPRPTMSVLSSLSSVMVTVVALISLNSILTFSGCFTIKYVPKYLSG